MKRGANPIRTESIREKIFLRINLDQVIVRLGEKKSVICAKFDGLSGLPHSFGESYQNVTRVTKLGWDNGAKIANSLRFAIVLKCYNLRHC